jgi:pseudouridine-5'-phosphate glycosidase
VIGYGTDCFPLFYVRESAHQLVDRVDDPVTAAAVAGAHWGFARSTGLVVAQPVAEELALDADQLEALITRAVALAVERGLHGPAVTPFVLSQLHARTDGSTLATNARLVCDNAELAARIAVAYYA